MKELFLDNMIIATCDKVRECIRKLRNLEIEAKFPDCIIRYDGVELIGIMGIDTISLHKYKGDKAVVDQVVDSLK